MSERPNDCYECSRLEKRKGRLWWCTSCGREGYYVRVGAITVRMVTHERTQQPAPAFVHGRRRAA